ncbi:glycosyltransferase [Parabacteroides sp. ZJ-118]|uniref:glycosyltransferase n=1 Tax=Parabacteroides sp. ZJ-118 TaxID=2709398 RepID=UPI0013EB846A|nr:glycosyltransferase [Parabacteroides sp. ZJ-118]
MKFLQLNVTANWGSTGKIAEGIGQAAMARGWESTIAYGRNMNPSQSQLVKVGNKYDVYAHYAQHRLFDREGLGSKRPTKRLIKWIDSYCPDIIHLHNIHDHWLNYPILFQYLSTIDTPIVWTFHDCWAFTGGCAHFNDVNCSKWQTECGRECKIPRALIDNTHNNFQLKKRLLRDLSQNLTIVSVSHWLDSLVAKSIFKDLDHRVIYNGIDTSVFYPRAVDEINQKFTLEGKCVLIGVSNVWTERKGLNDYVALCQRLPEKFVIILVGLSPRQIKSLPPRIIGIPRTNSVGELATLYSRADAVLCLSKAETFGLTLVEGLACGTPSIGYADTAIKELLSPKVGIPVRPGDIDELSKALFSLAESKICFDSGVCRKRAEQFFNKDIQYDKYVDLYSELLSVDNQIITPPPLRH